VDHEKRNKKALNLLIEQAALTLAQNNFFFHFFQLFRNTKNKEKESFSRKASEKKDN